MDGIAMNQDVEHLRLLSIFHYVMAGLTALFACFPVLHLAVGLFMLFAPDSMLNQNRDCSNVRGSENVRWSEIGNGRVGEKEHISESGTVSISTKSGTFPKNHSAHGAKDAEGDVMMLRFMGGFFVTIATLIILSGWAMAYCLLLAGRRLKQHRSYTFCLVIAALSCAIVPLGTVLGVFTIIVLMRPSVKTLFESAQAEAIMESQNMVS